MGQTLERYGILSKCRLFSISIDIHEGRKDLEEGQRTRLKFCAFWPFNKKKFKLLKVPMTFGTRMRSRTSSWTQLSSTSWSAQHIKVYWIFKLNQWHAVLEGCELTVWFSNHWITLSTALPFILTQCIYFSRITFGRREICFCSDTTPKKTSKTMLQIRYLDFLKPQTQTAEFV